MTALAKLSTDLRRIRVLVRAGADLARMARVTGLPVETVASVAASPAMRASASSA
jgi:hypothetical protein